MQEAMLRERAKWTEECDREGEEIKAEASAMRRCCSLKLRSNSRSIASCICPSACTSCSMLNKFQGGVQKHDPIPRQFMNRF